MTEHVVPDGFRTPSVETRPLELQPDIVAPDSSSSREELEMGLRRAQLVADDCAALLDPAQRAMEDGAWVSRLADEFSTGLTVHARLAGGVAEDCVETIQAALDARGDDELTGMRPR